MSLRRIASVLLLVVSVNASVGRAQGVWIVTESWGAAGRGVVVFDDAGGAGGVRLPDQATQFRVWRLNEDRALPPVVHQPGQSRMEFAVDREEADATFGLSHDFGVIQHRDTLIRLCCHAKSHIAAAPSTWRNVRVRQRMPLELSVSREGPRFSFQVRFAGRRLATTRVTVFSPERLRTDGLTDGDGRFACELPHSGIYGIRTEFVDSKPGERNGERYPATHHIATLTFPAEVVPQKIAALVAHQIGTK